MADTKKRDLKSSTVRDYESGSDIQTTMAARVESRNEFDQPHENL